jgi:importin subunit beta-1
MGFLRTCMSEEDRTDQFATATLGLIGDFGETYKKQVRDVLLEEWVVNAIAYGRQRGASKQARRNATYAQKVGFLCLLKYIVVELTYRRSEK